MNRRHFLMGTAAGAAAARAAAGQRNILLLYCEQFQHNVSSLPGDPARTPNLEHLAAQEAPGKSKED